MNTLDRLARQRPTATEIDLAWSPAERADTLERLLAQDPHPVSSPANPVGRRWRVPAALGVAAAVAVAVPFVLPHGTPGGATPAAARELDRLAHITAATPSGVAKPGQFTHVLVRQWQTPDPSHGQGEIRSLHDSWSSNDRGTWFRLRSLRPDGTTKRTEVGRSDLVDDPMAPTPTFLASLPTDPAQLNAWLRQDKTGSASADERVFDAVGDIMRSGRAPGPLRLALLQVLKRTPHVTLGDATADSTGRPAVEFAFVDSRVRRGMVQSLLFSTQTAQVIEQIIQVDDKPWFTSTTEVFEVTSGVPCSVVERSTDPDTGRPAIAPAEVRRSCTA